MQKPEGLPFLDPGLAKIHPPDNNILLRSRREIAHLQPAAMNAARRLPRLSRTLIRPIRPLSTASPPPSTIHQLLSSARSANPLKDAVKFLSAPDTTIWTYQQLHSHVAALAAGLHQLSYSSNNILTVLPPQSPEYSVLLLAAARIGAVLIPLPPPPDPSALDIQTLRQALLKHRPDALVIHHDYRPSGHVDDDGIVASINPVLHALDPDVALHDAAGRSGFVPLTGHPFTSRQFPFLRHVIHTADTNMRATITFKSLLVYSGESLPPAPSAPLLVLDDKQVTEKHLIKQAHKLGKKLALSSDHTTREGKLVIKPGLGQSTATAVVAAVMHKALWVNPGTQDTKDVSASENALVA